MVNQETTFDVMAAVEQVRPVIEEHADHGESSRELAPQVFDAFRESGLLRMAIPESHGGLEMDPVTVIGVFEALAAIDGSAAWVLNQQYAVTLLAAWASDGIHELYANPDSHWAGVFWPPGAAVATDGGYRVTSRVGFASGCRRAEWFVAPAVVMQEGEPVVDADTGQPDFLAACMPTRDLEIVDTWFTLGMRATGSNDVIINEVFVPEKNVAHVFRLKPRPRDLANPMYGMIPWPAIHAHASITIGIARAALDEALRIARTKVPNFLQVALKDKEVVQADLARARALLESASCYLRQTMTDAVATVGPSGPGVEQQISLQLSANQAASAAEETMRLVHRSVGTSTVRDETGMGRRYRDLNTITQHTSIQPARWESVGKVMFGLPSDWFPFSL